MVQKTGHSGMALKPVDDTRPERKRTIISLRLLMIVGFGGLVALSVGGVLAISIYTNLTNTLQLLNRQAVTLIDGMEESIHHDAGEGERVVNGIASFYENGGFEIGNTETLQLMVTTLLKSGQLVENIMIVDRNRQMFGLGRSPKGEIIELAGPSKTASQSPEHAIFGTGHAPGSSPLDRAFATVPAAADAVWLEPTMVKGRLFHNVVRALRRDGEVHGIAIAAVGPYGFNRAVQEISKDNGTTVFIADNKGHVISHSHQPHLFKEKPRIALDAFPDAAVRAFAAGVKDIRVSGDENMRIGAAEDENENEYVFISRDITAMADKPYTLTAYFNAADVGTELKRVTVSAGVGGVALILALGLAVFFGNRLSRPLRRISESASQFADLDLDSYQPMSRSRVREIDEQNTAMNAMHTALSQFGQYVPKELVRRLLHSGTEATRSVEREITVMFTDVTDFTAMSESMNAADVVTVLNAHFDVLCDEIAKHQGTVDKFMGDGLMAFWGAPQADAQHARHALDAAAAIAESFEEHNRLRISQGQPPLRLRIGLHTGRAVIGNIGGADRHNYTVVGDIVNVASRLEQLGKELIGDDTVVACVSSACRKAAGNPVDLAFAGSHQLRGRKEPIGVYTLILDETVEMVETVEAKSA